MTTVTIHFNKSLLAVSTTVTNTDPVLFSKPKHQQILCYGDWTSQRQQLAS